MKTATITFHASNNNGSFLQAYALQQTLKNTFDLDNDIIDFQSETQLILYATFRKVHQPKDLIKNVVSLLHYSKHSLRHRRFEAFRRDRLSMTARCATEEEVYSIAQRYDLLIAGSDQIWNQRAPDFSPAFFLPQVSGKKITYSTSFGSVADSSALSLYKQSIQEFSHISMRESAGAQVVEPICRRNIPVTLDPTLLLSAQDYDILYDRIPLINRPYIFLYSINYHDYALEAVKELSQKYKIPVVTAFTSFHTITCLRHGIQIQYDAGPAEFLNLIRNASLVATNSFHGTAFSIIFRKDFYYLCRQENGRICKDDRIDDLLQSLGIQGRHYAAGCSEVLPLRSICWDIVEAHLAEKRQASLDYLRTALDL